AQSLISRSPPALEATALAGASRHKSAVRRTTLRMKRCGDGVEDGGPPAQRAVTVSSLPRPARRIQRGANAVRPGGGGVGAYVLACLCSQAGAQAAVVVQAAERARQRLGVARWHDQSVALMAHEVAGGGADGIGGDDRQSLVHGFVDDEPPRLAEGSGAQ